MSVEPIFVSVQEAARILGMSRSTLYEEIAAGKLRKVKRGRSTLIPLEDVRRYADDLLRQAQSA